MRKLSLKRAWDAFFFGFGQAFNITGRVADRGRYARGSAGDAEAIAGDWRRSLERADDLLKRQSAERSYSQPSSDQSRS